LSARPDIRALVRDHRLELAALLVAGAILVWHSWRYGFVTDDAYISFVYARNLAEHGELVFNPGLPPVEGYTNFLWTALLGGAAALGLPLEATALVLGAGFAVATLAVVFRLASAILGGPSPWCGVAPLLLSLTAGYACWASGGLETQMFTFWVTLAIHLAVTSAAAPRRFRHVGWVLALAAMTRPEGLLVAGVIGVHRLGWNLIAERRVAPSRDELVAAAWFVGLWAPWFAWRWWYYGWPLPNTAYVKAAGEAAPGYDDQMREAGLYYVGQWLRQTDLRLAFPLVLAGLVGRPGSARLRFGSLAAPLAALYLAYTISVGGDFMGLHRFLMPLFPLVALGAALGGSHLAGLLPAGRLRLAGYLALAALLVAGHGVRQLGLTATSIRPGNYRSDRGIDTPAFLAAYAHDRALIGKAMAPCFSPGDFAIYGGAGAKPFFARLPGIDVFGLVSERIAHEVPRTRPRAGHNKWGPDALLLEHEPTFVFSCYDLHRQPDRPRLPCSVATWKRRGFVPVTMRVPGLRERGEYYTFLAREDRRFSCPGVVE
jgi:arabinofuranosyltransferase